MAGNESLSRASRAKKDEFYTRLTDIEKELRHYKKHFLNKTVFCNCDDPFESNFFKYFVLNFNHLGLKKLIATCYASSPIANQQISLFDVVGGDEANKNKPYKAVITKVYDITGDGGIDMLDIAELFKNKENELTELEGDGDFRSQECLDLLKQADIVVTNPPFSLFREYVAKLMEYDKKFIIWSNTNAVTYKEIFPLIKESKIWGGFHFNKTCIFQIPKHYEKYDEKITKEIDDENHYCKVPSIATFTNLDIKKRHEDLILVKKYNPDDYPKYDNYDAIEVSKVADIPYDYDGVMGVPITFLDKYNPEQFEILGISKTWATQFKFGKSKVYKNATQFKQNGDKSNGNKVNDGPVLALKERPAKGSYYKAENSDNFLIQNYARIFIRNLNPEIREES